MCVYLYVVLVIGILALKKITIFFHFLLLYILTAPFYEVMSYFTTIHSQAFL